MGSFAGPLRPNCDGAVATFARHRFGHKFPGLCPFVQRYGSGQSLRSTLSERGTNAAGAMDPRINAAVGSTARAGSRLFGPAPPPGSAPAAPSVHTLRLASGAESDAAGQPLCRGAAQGTFGPRVQAEIDRDTLVPGVIRQSAPFDPLIVA